MTSGKKAKQEFSYEDKGLLRLNTVLLVLLGALFCLMVRTFIKYFRQEGKWIAPHPIMLYSLAAQMFGIFL